MTDYKNKGGALPASPDRAVVNGAASVSALRASVPSADPFADAVWAALKGDHNDLRKQAIILRHIAKAHWPTPAPITTTQST